MPPRYDVFISCAGEDKHSLAILIYEGLKRRGISAFLDEKELRVGGDAAADIDHAMQTALMGLFILSPEFALKYHPMLEVKVFLNRADAFGRPGHWSGAPRPRLIPVFYRLTVAQCKYTAAFSKVYCDRKIWDTFNNRVSAGETSVESVLESLSLLARYTGVENTNGIGNDETKEMVKGRWMLAQKICNAVSRALVDLSSKTDAKVGSIDVAKHSAQNELYAKFFAAPENPEEIVLDFSSACEAGQPKTCEAAVLRLVLRSDKEARIIGLVGAGGVGKSCILRAVANNMNVKDSFPGGVYFISLGMDPSIATSRSGLLRLLHVMGGDGGDVDVILEEIGKLVRKEKSMVLLDDIWPRNGVTERVISDLLGPFSEEREGIVIFTTRFASVARAATDLVHIGPREALSETSRRILLNYAKFSEEEVERAGVEWVVEKLLLLAEGMPALLATEGLGVRTLAAHLLRRRWKAWEMYWKEISRRPEALFCQNVDGYQGLSTIPSALLVLEESKELHARKGLKYTWMEMYRSLCVMQKRAAMPVSVFGRMWQMHDEADVETIVEGFSSVGLGQISFSKEMEITGLRIHDSLHDFAVSLVKYEGEISEWHQRLLDGYIPRGVGVRKWWTLNDDGYVFENLCRHLANSGATEELVGLLLSPEWTVFRHQVGGLRWLRRDFSECLDALESHTMDEKEREELRKGLCLVRDAIGDCWTYVSRNRRELGYQIFGRLRDVEKGPARKYLESVGAWHPKPWLQPINRCLPKPGEAGRGGEFMFSNIVNDVVLHEDPFFAVVGVGREVFVIDLEGMQARKVFVGHSADFRKVWLSGDGERVLSWGMDRTVREWDVTVGDEVRVVRLERDGVDEVQGKDKFICSSFSADGKYVTMGSRGGDVKVCDVSSGNAAVDTLKGFSGAVTCVQMSLDGSHIVAGGSDGTVRVWGIPAGAPLGNPLRGHNGPVRCIALSADGRQLVSGSGDETIRLWDLDASAQIGEAFRGHSEDVLCVAWSADGRRIVSGSADTTVRVWDARSGNQIGPVLRGHSSQVMCVAVSASGRFVASGGADWRLRIWDLEAVVEAVVDAHEKPHGHNDAVWCLTGSADGRLFISGSCDSTLMIWDAQTGKPIGDALRGHGDIVTCVSVSPDSLRCVSGSWNEKLIVWDLNSRVQIGEPICTRTGHVNCVAYSPDGRFILSGSDDEKVKIWSTDNHAHSGAVSGRGRPSRKEAAAMLPERVWEFVKRFGAAPQSDVIANGDSSSTDGSSDNEQISHVTREILMSIDENSVEHDSSAYCIAMTADGRRMLCGLENGRICVWDVNSLDMVGEPQVGHKDPVVRIDLSAGNEVRSLDQEGNEIRWRLDEERGLIQVPEFEGVGADSLVKVGHDDSTQGWGQVVCRGRLVQSADGDITLATLPSAALHQAWHYNAERGVLAVGTEDGRVFIFQVEE